MQTFAASLSNIVWNRGRLIRLLVHIVAQRMRSGMRRRISARTRQIKAADRSELVVDRHPLLVV